MIRNFKFFHGHIDGNFVLYTNGNRAMTVAWGTGETTIGTTIDAAAELTRMMSEEIARGIDEEIIETLTRSINGGSNRVVERNVNVDYLQRYLDMGENRA